jgi:hypothetical protein
MRSFHKHGFYNAVCDVCGFNFKSDELRQRWDGLMVCRNDFELRNPQDLIRIPTEDTSVPWSRPPIIPSTYYACTVDGSSGIAGLAVAGCAHAGSLRLN